MLIQEKKHCGYCQSGLSLGLEDHCAARTQCGVQPKGITFHTSLKFSTSGYRVAELFSFLLT